MIVDSFVFSVFSGRAGNVASRENRILVKGKCGRTKKTSIFHFIYLV